MKLKTYLANCVWLGHVPNKHAASNGCKSFTILCRTSNQKELAKLIGGNTSLHSLKVMGLHTAPERFGFNGQWLVADIVKKDHTIYYLPEHTKNGPIREWFEYERTPAQM